jgi:hypothetical protein
MPCNVPGREPVCGATIFSKSLYRNGGEVLPHYDESHNVDMMCVGLEEVEDIVATALSRVRRQRCSMRGCVSDKACSRRVEIAGYLGER